MVDPAASVMPANRSRAPLRQSLPLDPKKIIKKTITTVLGILFLGGIFSISFGAFALGYLFIKLVSVLHLFWAFVITSLFISILPLGVLVFLSYLYQKAYFEKYFYDVRDGFLVIKKGVFMPKETTLPFEKLNDVYVDQDILDRVFGLYDVHFSTATAQSGLSAHIDGLVQENAYKLRDLMMQLIKNSTARK